MSKDSTAEWETEFPKPFKILVNSYDPVICLTAMPRHNDLGVCLLPFELTYIMSWAIERTFKYSFFLCDLVACINAYIS